MNEHGYGVIAVGGGRARLAHRILWEITHDIDLDDDQKVCHRCDNPKCCNIAHLFIGTQAENLADMAAKGRRDVSGLLARDNRGTRHGMAKLTEEDVRKIRRAVTSGAMSQRKVAALFGVSQPVVSDIVRRVSWTHVE